MNQQQLAERITDAMEGAVYSGSLTSYAAQSIESARSNYPVSNLMTYCQDSGLQLIMEDMATEDTFHPKTVFDIHYVLDFLMRRYLVDSKMVYRKTGIHYTPPKSLNTEDLESQDTKEGRRYSTSLSVKTLLAVCEVIHCDLKFRRR